MTFRPIGEIAKEVAKEAIYQSLLKCSEAKNV